MRASALAAAAAALAVTWGAAEARPWNDPAGRLTFDAPAGWTVNTPNGPSNGTFVIAGNANNECQFLAISNPATATASAEHMRSQGGDPARFSSDVWTRALGQFPDLANVQIQSTAVDTSGAWPIQRAEARVGDRPVHGAIQVRPGFDIFTACLTYGGADPIETYNQVIRSVGHPSDAASQ